MGAFPGSVWLQSCGTDRYSWRQLEFPGFEESAMLATPLAARRNAMITDGQVRKLFRDLENGSSLSVAARRAGMDEKTARKYRDLKSLPSTQVPAQRTYRTRIDPFAAVWQQVQERLEAEPGLQAKTMFDWLKREYPGQFSDSQRRTFERRVLHWRATSGPTRSVMFRQVHFGGDLAASDFTCMNSLEITILGRRFEHIIYHFVLTYSNWESVTVCGSESFESLSEGLQNAFWELGGVPKRHRSDSLTAAVNNLSSRREFRARYQHLLDHYGVAGERINVREPHENGDSESSHGHFKNAVDQALLLRGNREFASHEAYLTFLQEMVGERNRPRQKRFAEEIAALTPLPSQRLESCQRLTVRVDTGSLIHINRNVYSVHSRLIGLEVEARLYADRVEVWYGGLLVDTLPRLVGRDKQAINYRHIIDSLVRKPGAFENYRYREDLFPNSRFRMAYDRLRTEHAPKVATRDYLKILQHAARDSELAVDDALRSLLSQKEPLTATAVIALAQSKTQLPAATSVTVEMPDLRCFDELLEHKDVFDVETKRTTEFPDSGAAPEPRETGEQPGTTAPVAAYETASIERATQGSAATDIPREFPISSGTGGTRGVGSCSVSGGTDEPGMPGPKPQPYPTSAPQFASDVGEDLGTVSMVASPLAGGSPGTDPTRWDVSRSPRERTDIWEAGFWKDAPALGVGGTTGSSGTIGLVHQLQLSRAGVAHSQTRAETGQVHQADSQLRSADHRRPGVCPTESGGDGSSVHVTSGTLRTGERALNEQSAVLPMGANLQGSHDDGRRHRPLGASQCDHRVEHPQFPLGDSQEFQAGRHIGGASTYNLSDNSSTFHPGILIVAKAEF